MLDFAEARRNMVDNQVRTFDVTDRAVLAAMDEVPRERFVPADALSLAYLDRAIDLRSTGDDHRVMLPPMVLARMLQALAIEAGKRVLDVGGGLGYSAALLVRLGAEVVTLEEDGSRARALRERLGEADLAGSVKVLGGELDGGAPTLAPFDVILVNGGVERPPTALIGQLSEGGRLACVEVGDGPGRAVLHVRAGAGTSARRLFDIAAPTLSAFRRAPHFTF